MAEQAHGTLKVKTGFAEMMKGGVIMDVVNPEQAKTRARWPSWLWSAFPPTSARTAAWPA